VETGAVSGVLKMIIFCEECGERYVIEQHKIKEKVIMFNCRICRYLIKVTTPNFNATIPAEGETTKS
jgi:DNA-directed RNA polymerase subunit M/transcription elongation factor TFIIS